MSDLIALKQLSGLDPFKPLPPDPLAASRTIIPSPRPCASSRSPQAVKDSGLKVEDLDYLLRHRFDETGKYRPNRDATLALD